MEEFFNFLSLLPRTKRYLYQAVANCFYMRDKYFRKIKTDT